MNYSLLARGIAVVFMTVAPTLAAFSILAAADRDWSLCFNEAVGGTMLWYIAQDLWFVVSNPVLGVLTYVGFLALSVLWAASDSRAVFAVWAVFCIGTLYPLYSGGWHDCDRKGSDLIFLHISFQLFGVVIAFISLLFLHARKD